MQRYKIVKNRLAQKLNISKSLPLGDERPDKVISNSALFMTEKKDEIAQLIDVTLCICICYYKQEITDIECT